jgi:hypothetical protein
MPEVIIDNISSKSISIRFLCGQQTSAILIVFLYRLSLFLQATYPSAAAAAALRQEKQQQVLSTEVVFSMFVFLMHAL